MTYLVTAVDHLVDSLYKEWQTAEATITTPFLMKERRDQHHAASQKQSQKRSTLTSYVPNL